MSAHLDATPFLPDRRSGVLVVTNPRTGSATWRGADRLDETIAEAVERHYNVGFYLNGIDTGCDRAPARPIRPLPRHRVDALRGLSLRLDAVGSATLVALRLLAGFDVEPSAVVSVRDICCWALWELKAPVTVLEGPQGLNRLAPDQFIWHAEAVEAQAALAREIGIYPTALDAVIPLPGTIHWAANEHIPIGSAAYPAHPDRHDRAPRTVDLVHVGRSYPAADLLQRLRDGPPRSKVFEPPRILPNRNGVPLFWGPGGLRAEDVL